MSVRKYRKEDRLGGLAAYQLLTNGIAIEQIDDEGYSLSNYFVSWANGGIVKHNVDTKKLLSNSGISIEYLSKLLDVKTHWAVYASTGKPVKIEKVFNIEVEDGGSPYRDGLVIRKKAPRIYEASIAGNVITRATSTVILEHNLLMIRDYLIQVTAKSYPL